MVVVVVLVGAGECRGDQGGEEWRILHLAAYILHPTLYIFQGAPCILHRAPHPVHLHLARMCLTSHTFCANTRAQADDVAGGAGADGCNTDLRRSSPRCSLDLIVLSCASTFAM